ncbi:hypothetical protein NW752_003255 [Fusarium irregulare]|uniref:Uncharacterized protein n=1 Tax=Fusarium irregulare TaxID=2494466 RepID=A0A9W8Q186_9HYPO|nr:hypothetical protein NW766_000943 [Fusarium irregulare]KAJ4025779.1 hypothetical protein NW752_003255 [Fusarium irregulare]
MRFSLQSFSIYLVSTQAGLALAGPCRPLTTSSVSATTTTAASEEVSTIATISDVSTVTSKEETSTTAVGEESTTTMALDISTTATLAEESTSVTVAETTTTILAEATTTTVAEESTTKMAETTTTIAAETTTTASGPTASFYAQYNDGSEVGLYLQSDGFVGTTEAGSTKATFSLETDTSRLYVTRSDGSKLYAYTVIPTGGNYGFLFDSYDNISLYPNVYHFVTCAADSQNVLTCSSEVGPTRIFWYLPGNSPNVYGNSNSVVTTYPGNRAVQFRLPVA